VYAVLDLGSNSFHLVVAKQGHGKIEIVHTYSKKVQLAEGLSENGKILKSARERALEALREIRRELSSFSLEHFCVVGTNTFREARNAANFIEQVNALGFPVNVISGLQEAYYVFLGAQAFLPHCSEPRLIFDIGGGSTEFALGTGEISRLASSLPIGCVVNRLQDSGSDNEKITRKDIAKIRRIVHDILDKKLDSAFYDMEWSECYASSGTAKMLSSVLRETGITDGAITETGLQELETKAINIGKTNLLDKLPGLKPGRRNVFISGLAIMQSIIDHLGIDHVDYSDFSLREGVLLSMVRQGKNFSLYALHGQDGTSLDLF
jgi:exopolyphosphatase/guanosine-5'-triphosphate,3'-diphosphate pyrophosphatase